MSQTLRQCRLKPLLHFNTSSNMARPRGARLPEASKRYQNAFLVLRRAWENFSRITSISGVSNAGISTSFFRRTCWMVVFTFFSLLTVMGLKNVIDDYLAYPVTTSVEIKHQNRVIILYILIDHFTLSF